MLYMAVAYNSSHNRSRLGKKKLMHAMSDVKEARELSGRVEIDNAYLGTERMRARLPVVPNARCPLHRRPALR